MLGLKLYLVELRGNARYHVAIVPNEWLLAFLNTLICVVSMSCGRLREAKNNRKFQTVIHKSGRGRLREVASIKIENVWKSGRLRKVVAKG